MKKYPVFWKNDYKEDGPMSIFKTVYCPSCSAPIATGTIGNVKKKYRQIICPKCGNNFLVTL